MLSNLSKKFNNKLLFKNTLIFGFLIILSIFISVIFSKIVPFNMDEFIHYHPIACLHYEYNSANIINLSCEANNLTIFNITLPLRAYDYLGSFRALIYYPLFIIWQSPISARFIGLLFLLIEGIVLSRIFKVKYYYFFIGFLLFFPYFFIHTVDTGPVAFHLISIYLIYYLLLRWKNEEKLHYPFIIGAISLFAIWEKPIFLIYSLPLFILFLYLKPSKKMWKQLVLPVLTILIALVIFLSATTNDGHHYYNDIFKKSNSIESVSELIHSPVLYSLVNPYYATHRIYNVNPLSLFTIIYSLFILLSPFIVGRRRKEYLFFYILFIIQILLIALLRQAFAMHHTILAFPFLVLSFMYSIDLKDIKKIKIWFVSFIILNTIIFVSFTFQKPLAESDESLIEINTILNNEKMARKYYYVVLDWGDYYYQSLYGPKGQSVISIDPTENISILNNLHNRKLLFIYNKNSENIKMIKKIYPLDICFSKKWVIATKQEEGGCEGLK